MASIVIYTIEKAFERGSSPTKARYPGLIRQEETERSAINFKNKGKDMKRLSRVPFQERKVFLSSLFYRISTRLTYLIIGGIPIQER